MLQQQRQAFIQSALAIFGRGHAVEPHQRMQAQEAGAALAEITHAVAQMRESNTQIATAAEQQSAVTEEINRSMVQIRQMVEELVQSGHATETNTQSLLEANGRVISLMSRFKVR